MQALDGISFSIKYSRDEFCPSPELIEKEKFDQSRVVLCDTFNQIALVDKLSSMQLYSYYMSMVNSSVNRVPNNLYYTTGTTLVGKPSSMQLYALLSNNGPQISHISSYFRYINFDTARSTRLTIQLNNDIYLVNFGNPSST